MEATKKKEPWCRTRHRVVTALARPVMWLFCRWKYGYRGEKFLQQGDRPYLVLLNHQTPMDQFFAGLSFRGPVYYMATEDIFSMGWVSRLIRWAVAPIPIRKQTTDITAVMTCIRVAREGGSICIAPEGNRSYSGRTEYMNPSIAALAKKLKLPIALFRLEGGYGVQPRWSDCVRRGRLRGRVARVIEPEEVETLSRQALLEQIRQGLFVDDCAAGGTYRSKKAAEYLERAYYVCPNCGITRFHSRGQRFWCESCGAQGRYEADLTLTGDLPFRTTTEWYDYQQDHINSLDVTQMTREPICRETASVYRVIVYKRKELLRQKAQITLYGDRVVLGEQTLDFEEVSAVAVLGRNKLNIYHTQGVFQLKGDRSLCALKFVHIYHRYKNITRGEANDQFLGL